MLAFPEMLVDAAERANIAVPGDLEDYDKEKHAHWFILCATQLCRPMQPGEHWENAKVIAGIPASKLKTLTWNDFQDIGVV